MSAAASLEPGAGNGAPAEAAMYRFYIQQYQIYKEKYGPQTAIFLQVGKFYEFYDIQEHGETQANVREIVDLLGVQMSRKNIKGLGPDRECLFAGVPDAALHRWGARLTALGWTIVVFDQVKDHRDHVVTRKISRILTPSTHIEAVSSTETPFILSIVLMEVPHAGPLFGAALLDLTTGTTKTYTGQARGRPDLWTADDLIQLMSVYPPREIMVRGQATVETLRRVFCLPPSTVLRVYPFDPYTAFGSPTSRGEYLQKIYQIRSVLPPRRFLSLRTDEEELALLYALQFIEEHCPSLLRQFHRNEPWVPNLRLICGNHALTQLQMTSADGKGCVMALFDKAITPMGKRATKERLLTPYTHAADIQARLREVSEAYEWPAPLQNSVLSTLRSMFDLPRLHRRLLCGLITPAEITHLYQTYHAIEALAEHLKETALESPMGEEWKAYRTFMDRHLSEEKAILASDPSTAASVTVLQSAAYPPLGQKEAEIAAHRAAIDEARTELMKATGLQESAIRVEESANGCILRVTTVGIKHLKKIAVKDMRIIEKASASYGMVETPALVQANLQLGRARAELAEMLEAEWADVCQILSQEGSTLWPVVEDWVAHVDVTQCLARVSKECGFQCPTVMQGDSASVEIQQLRHPLVEASATRSTYMKHNVSLGGGWLVYGMNASGKSTLMKATGICILLAQAGCFVPAQSMQLSPFRAVYTRILNQDNLFAGLSSFAVEMSELRDILQGADKDSLVLGDELCAGTESLSAQALVLSGIHMLTERGAKFIFATHLHGLANAVMKGVEVWHLHVEYDPITQKLVYDRSLRRGQGSTLYGLEVARAMGLPASFIEQALAYRHQLAGSTTQELAPTSSWSRDVQRRECEMCHAVTAVRELEVHHIQERSSATPMGILPDGTHMNDKRNLITLCEKCHDLVHAEEIVIPPILETSDGPQRVVSPPPSPPSPPSVPAVVQKRGKWTAEQMQVITDTLRNYPNMAMKLVRGMLQRHDIVISEGTLRAIKLASHAGSNAA